jgi:patatin-like phospholipase/acyl hydrolase
MAHKTSESTFIPEHFLIQGLDSTPRMPRILSLDGGGVRGLSSLLILQNLMKEVRRVKNLDHDPLPCQYFDLMGGTSTGGLIAIMLGRLHMVYTDLRHH